MDLWKVNFEEVDAEKILKDIRSRAIPLGIGGMREDPGVLHFEHISSFFCAKEPVIGELDTNKMDHVKPKSNAVDDEDAKMATAAESEVDTTDDFRTNTMNLFEVSEFSLCLVFTL
jgi:hypothetical protein